MLKMLEKYFVLALAALDLGKRSAHPSPLLLTKLVSECLPRFGFVWWVGRGKVTENSVQTESCAHNNQQLTTCSNSMQASDATLCTILIPMKLG